MDFEKAVPENVRKKLIPNVVGWIPLPTPGTLAHLAAGLPDVVPLSKGDVGFSTPEHIREAAKRAIDTGQTGYTYLRELRVAITEKLARDNGISAGPDDEIVVSDGCHAILAQVFGALVGPGDEVVMGSPDLYFHNHTLVRGGTPIFVNVHEARGFHLDPDVVATVITPRTKVIALTTPDGPVGAVHTRADLEKIAALAQAHDLLVIADEIYEKINYDTVPHFSIASLPGMRERTITINGFSKGYAMTGWRVGYAVVPAHLILAVRAVNALHTIQLNFAGQYAAIEAVRGPQDFIARNVAEYQRKMRLLAAGINGIDGLSMSFPEATYYGWVNISALGVEPHDFARHCLLAQRVSVLPGTNFWGEGGRDYIRVSCSAPEDTLREGLRRLEMAVRSLRAEGLAAPAAAAR
jgi:aminotransferase